MMVAAGFTTAAIIVLLVGAGMIFLGLSCLGLGLHWLEIAYAILTQN